MIKFSKDISKYYIDLIDESVNSEQDISTNINSLKSIFNLMLKELTVDENIIFSNYISRLEFIKQELSLNDDDSLILNNFRRLSYVYSKSEKDKLSEINYFTIYFLLIKSLGLFSDSPLPAKLLKQIESLDISIDIKTDTAPKEILSSKCIVLNKTDISTNPDGKKYFSVYCDDVDTQLLFSYRIFDTHIKGFEKLHQNIRRYSTLQIIGIYIQNPDKYFYTSTRNSLIILEPDFLIEASEIAECFSSNFVNENIFFLKKLLAPRFGLAALKGKVINDLMDSLIVNPALNPQVEINKILSKYVLQLASYDNQTVADLKNNILEVHYPTLHSVFNRRINNSKIKIEPTFFSPKYGLNGRLDALVIPEQNETKRNIFELKSGTPSNYDIWINQKMQLTCYNLLLKSAYKENEIGVSFILYSKDKNKPFRSVSFNIENEMMIADVRNSIVAEIFRLSENNFTILNKILNNKFGEIPPFSVDDFLLFKENLKSLSDIQSRYYRNLISFSIREYKFSKIGSNDPNSKSGNGFASLWLNNLDEKENQFEILHSLKLSEFDTANNILEFDFTKPITHNFREGDAVIAYKRTTDEYKPLNSEIYRGTLTKISDKLIIFRFRNIQLDEEYFAKNTEWIIEHDIIESNFWNSVSSLSYFLYTNNHKRDLLLGITEPCFTESLYIDNPDLSPDQNENIRKAVNAVDYFLLQGPPGTGKTSVALINILKHFLSDKYYTENKIVILAYTNRAVDEICSKLENNGIEFLQIGGKQTKDFIDTETHSDIDTDEFRNIFITNKIFVSTVSSFMSKYLDLSSIVNLDTLIVDEASQLTESDLAGILSVFRKFILIGDQNQLPAVIIQSENQTKVKDTYLNQISINNFNQSLFERLYKRCLDKKWYNAIGMLESHYRMHNDIAELINHNYKNRLKSVLDIQSSTLNIYKDNEETLSIISSHRKIFIESKIERTSKTNLDEAKKIINILTHIKKYYNKDFNERTVGVVTPWRAQIALINSLISDDDIKKKVVIDTVERFQGSEKEIIIVSFAVYNPYQFKNLQSLNSDGIDRKLLVALSRAKEQIIILGNQKIFNKFSQYKELLDDITNNGLVINLKDSKNFFL